MFPPRNGFTILTRALVFACVALASSPNALGQDSPTPTPSPSATATATPTATATATPTPSTRLGNISTRSLTDVGNNVLIAGFIVTGKQQKKVIIRGIGPSLEFPGKLDDPTLELRNGKGELIKSNDNWRDSADKQAIFNTRVSPKHDSESAILATLPADATYTALLRGVNGGTGIGVVEVYDLDSTTADSKLANISTRGLVVTGDSVMIAGTIVIGPKMQDVIIRALGPSLSVVNKLSDPKLELHDENGTPICENDNWCDRPEPEKEAIFETGVAPTDCRESAIKTTLSPNRNYTAIVRDAAEASGSRNEIPSPTVTRTRHGSGNTVEIQQIQFGRAPVGGTLRLTFRRPPVIISGQPGDKAALEDTITIPWDATADEIKDAILASSNFYKYDQNNHLTAGPNGFHPLFDSGGGLGIEGNEGSRREPVITRSSTDLSDITIQFGTLTTGAVGVRNPWISGLPLIQVDDTSIIYAGGTAVVEVYALSPP